MNSDLEDKPATKQALRLQREADVRIADCMHKQAKALSHAPDPYDRIAVARWEILTADTLRRAQSLLQRKPHIRKEARR